MWVFVDNASRRIIRNSGYQTVDGRRAWPAEEVERQAAVTDLAGREPDSYALYLVTDDALARRIAEPTGPAPLLAVIEAGAVVDLEPDPDYTPPAPTPDPMQVRLEALEAAVSRNLLASPHDRRWLAQKERAKLFGIPWLREHPEAEQQDLEAAVLADLAEAFPAQPLVVSGGVIMSYAAEAAARGYIPDASFASLKSLILVSSEQQLQAMLAAL